MTFDRTLVAGSNQVDLPVPTTAPRRLWFIDGATAEAVPSIRLMFATAIDEGRPEWRLGASSRIAIGSDGMATVESAPGTLDYLAIAEGYGAVEGTLAIIEDVDDYQVFLDPLALVDVELQVDGKSIRAPSDWMSSIHLRTPDGHPITVRSRTVEHSGPSAEARSGRVTNMVLTQNPGLAVIAVIGVDGSQPSAIVDAPALEGFGQPDPVRVELRPRERSRAILAHSAGR